LFCPFAKQQVFFCSLADDESHERGNKKALKNHVERGDKNRYIPNLFFIL